MRWKWLAAGLPPATVYSSLGYTWTVQIATGSAFTNVAGMPTTRAELALYNGELSGGKSYLIEEISFLSLTSITAAASVGIIWQVGAPAALTDDTAQLINSPLGLVYNGRAKRAVAVTSMTANKWTVAATSPTSPAASIGTAVVADVKGRIIVRPGYTLGVNAVVGTATGTSLMGITWTEVEL